MAKESDSLEPLRICRRILNFIVSNLSGGSQGIKRVTLGGHDGRTLISRPESVEVPIEDPSRYTKMNKNTDKKPSKSNGEIVVEFRHIEGYGNGLTNARDQRNGDARIRGKYKGPHPKDIEIQPGNESEDTKAMAQRAITHLPVSGEPDINEMAEDFIQRRKAAMGVKVYSLEHQQNLN